ncbi:MAG: O-antigen ligase family protein [Acidimicrobiia bacterium]|nr:O-antigen ligase family protein [Acidimicrobiia bacterium]
MTTSARERLAGRGLIPFALAAAGAGAVTAGAALFVSNPFLIVIGIVGLAGAALIVLDERWAIGALAAFVVLHLPEVATDFHGAPSLFQPLVAGILLGVAARWAVTGRRPPGVAAALLLVGTYVLVAISSLLFSTLPVEVTGEALALVRDSGVALLVGLLLSRTASLRVAVWVMVASGAFLAAISVFQFLTGSFDSAFGGFGISSVEQIVGTYDDIRISGPVGDPNFYGQLLIVVLPLALDRMWGERTLRLRIIGGASAALIAAATIFTFSRGAAVALGAMLIMMAVVYRPSLRSIAAVAIVAVLAVPFLPPGYLDRLTALGDVGSVEGATDPSIRGRTAEVTAGWLMFLDRPFTGVGYGTYPDHYQDYVSGLGIELRSEARNAHSLYLEVAAETGLPGVAAMGALIVGAFAALQRGRRRFESIGLTREARTARALIASLVGFLITAVFLHLDFARLFWLLIGLSFALPGLAERSVAAAEPSAEVPA